MDSVISELCYKGTISHRNYRKMTISGSFSYKYFVKFHGKEFGNNKMTCLIQFCAIMRFVEKVCSVDCFNGEKD